jgi:hypothetical protein
MVVSMVDMALIPWPLLLANMVFSHQVAETDLTVKQYLDVVFFGYFIINLRSVFNLSLSAKL